MGRENLIEGVDDEFNHDHHFRRTPIQDHNVALTKTDRLTEKLTNEYVVLVDKVNELAQGLGKNLELLKHPNPIIEALTKVAGEHPESSPRQYRSRSKIQ
uniref:Uncharacterized protein n=1 Tax=Cucumis melo TaxID=3656 RepID=A0A9I9D7V2_CUCME